MRQSNSPAVRDGKAAGTVKTSDTGLAFIAAQEGFVDHPYQDIAGIWTIGFGHVMRHNETFLNPISRDVGLALLRGDLAIAEAAVNGHVAVPLTQPEFDACVSMAFNCGGAAFAGSSLCHMLNADTYASVDCARAFLKWDKALIEGELQVSKELHNRRLAEAAMFLGISVDEALAQLEPSPVAPFTGAVAVLPDVPEPEIDPTA